MKFRVRQYLKKAILFFSLPLLFSINLCSCAPLISPELRREIKENIALSLVKKDPDACRGKPVLWGGMIIKAENKKEGTLVEVLELPLDKSRRPKDIDSSEGRFLALYPEYLDVAIYRSGREVTVFGKIEGTRTLPLGEVDYTYPLIRAEKIRLWEKRAESIRVFHKYPFYPYWYGYPYYWGRPYGW